jgi:hypothetical protein
MDYPEKLTRRRKTKQNKICEAHDYAQTNPTNTNTMAPNIYFIIFVYMSRDVYLVICHIIIITDISCQSLISPQMN